MTGGEPSSSSTCSTWKDIGNRIMDANDYYNSLNDFPPTYSLNKLDSRNMQLFPDPVSKETIRRKADKIEKCERAMRDPKINKHRNPILRIVRLE